MFNIYSGTFFAAIVVAVVPTLIQWGFSEVCANEIVSIGLPFLVAGIVCLWRWAKGDVSIAGFRVDLRK